MRGYDTSDGRGVLTALFDEAVSYASADRFMTGQLPGPPAGRTLVIAVGKAAAPMAALAEGSWPEDRPLSGIALAPYGHGLPLTRLEMREAAHPVPDAAGAAAAQEILRSVSALGRDDLLLFLVSGGGSSLLSLPREGITAREKQALNRALLASGASIHEINTVRRQLSAIKGGRLAEAAHPADVITLALSDVPGDDPATIASGPTVPDPTTAADAQAVLQRYGLTEDVFPGAFQVLAKDSAEAHRAPEAPPDPDFRILSTPGQVLEQVAGCARAQGFEVLNLGAELEGEARELAREHAALALKLAQSGRPQLILSGGETTVTMGSSADAVKGHNPASRAAKAQGGRNTEYLLALAIALQGAPGVSALAADTDGIDGSSPAAGAVITPDTLSRARAMGVNVPDFLTRHDSYSFFEALDDLLVTGPTRTNVNDFRAILIEP